MAQEIISLEDISAALHDFYKAIESNKEDHYGHTPGTRTEPTHFRTPMIKFLIDNIESESIAVDLFCGDLVVSLAILYLQKETKKFERIKRVYAVDDNHDKGFDLISRNSRYFGLDSQIVPVLADISEQDLVQHINEKPDLSLVIEGSRYVVAPSYVYEPVNFFRNLVQLGPVNFTIQAGYIPIDYTEAYKYFFDFEEGKIPSSQGDINYYKGIVKKIVPEPLPFRFSRARCADTSNFILIGSEEDELDKKWNN